MSKEFLYFVRQILITKWDPIAICENSLLHDEYDTYAYKISSYLQENIVSEQHIYEMLKEFECKDIGICINDQKRKEIARELSIGFIKKV